MSVIKTFIFAKNPANGGIPAIENILNANTNARDPLDLCKTDKSPNSLGDTGTGFLVFSFKSLVSIYNLKT